ncbi:MAG: MFS transporter [Acidobacteria bacterium]|nr:MFS transporter [Acidobacteriota bacterium]
MGPGKFPPTRRWLLVAPALLLWWIIGQFDKSNISLVIADSAFLRELQLEGRFGELGGLMSTFFIGYGISIFLWGFLVDRWGPRICLVIGTIGWGAVMFLMSRASSLEEMLVARLLLGVAEGNMWPVSNALTNRWFPAREHSRAQAFWMMGPTSGTAIGVPLVTGLILASDWRGMMVALAVLSLVPLLAFSFIANRPRDQRRIHPSELAAIEADQTEAALAGQMEFRSLMKSGSFWLITLCMIISVTTIFTLIQWTPSFVITQRGLTRQSMSAWLTVGYILATFGTILVGSIGDRSMKRALTAAGTCLVFVLIVLPSALLLPPAWSAIALATLIAVPCGIAALNGALLHTMVRPEAVARATGIYSGVGSLVSAVGPWAFGALIGALDGQYWGGFIFLAALNAVGAICYLVLHRATRQPGGVDAVPSVIGPSPYGAGSVS